VADKFLTTWGKDVQDAGYGMVPFLALQVSTAATHLAVIACCYQYTWEGPGFDLAVAKMAAKMGVSRQVLHGQLRSLEEQELIEIGPGKGKTLHVNMIPLIQAINEHASRRQAELTNRPRRRVRQAHLTSMSNTLDEPKESSSSTLDKMSSTLDEKGTYRIEDSIVELGQQQERRDIVFAGIPETALTEQDRGERCWQLLNDYGIVEPALSRIAGDEQIHPIAVQAWIGYAEEQQRDEFRAKRGDRGGAWTKACCQGLVVKRLLAHDDPPLANLRKVLGLAQSGGEWDDSPT
jgi:hypothetical protein